MIHQEYAVAAVEMEVLTGIPAEFLGAQALSLSGGVCRGHNPFLVPSLAGAADFQIIEVDEELTAQQIRRVASGGWRIVDMSPPRLGIRTVRVQRRYMVFRSLAQAFGVYAAGLIANPVFRARNQRYQGHRKLPLFLREVCGSDGLPPQINSPAAFDRALSDKHFKAALAEARAAQPPINQRSIA